MVARQFIAWYPWENGNRPAGYGMIEFDRRATIRTTNQPGVGITPCPTGRILDWTRSSPESFRGWLRSLVPSGQQTVSPVHIFDSRPDVREAYVTQRARALNADKCGTNRLQIRPMQYHFPGLARFH